MNVRRFTFLLLTFMGSLSAAREQCASPLTENTDVPSLAAFSHAAGSSIWSKLFETDSDGDWERGDGPGSKIYWERGQGTGSMKASLAAGGTGNTVTDPAANGTGKTATGLAVVGTVNMVTTRIWGRSGPGHRNLFNP